MKARVLHIMGWILIIVMSLSIVCGIVLSTMYSVKFGLSGDNNVETTVRVVWKDDAANLCAVSDGLRIYRYISDTKVEVGEMFKVACRTDGTAIEWTSSLEMFRNITYTGGLVATIVVVSALFVALVVGVVASYHHAANNKRIAEQRGLDKQD